MGMTFKCSIFFSYDILSFPPISSKNNHAVFGVVDLTRSLPQKSFKTYLVELYTIPLNYSYTRHFASLCLIVLQLEYIYSKSSTIYEVQCIRYIYK